MKYKSTNLFVIIAAALGVLALAMNLLIYYGPQAAFLSAAGAMIEVEVTVTNVGATICSALIAAVYLLACIVTVKSDRAKDGWTVCLTALMIHIVINAAQLLFLNIFWTQRAVLQGPDYFIVHNSLNVCRQYLETPLFTLALVFLSVSFGTLCGRDDEPSQSQDGF